MDTPIVNEWFIYLLQIVDHITTMLEALITVIIGTAVLTIIFFPMLYGLLEENRHKEAVIRILQKKTLQRGMLIAIICLFLGYLFIPTRNTLIAMYMARQVTYERLAEAIETGQNLKDELKNDIKEILEVLTDNKKGEEQKRENPRR